MLLNRFRVNRFSPNELPCTIRRSKVGVRSRFVFHFVVLFRSHSKSCQTFIIHIFHYFETPKRHHIHRSVSVFIFDVLFVSTNVCCFYPTAKERQKKTETKTSQKIKMGKIAITSSNYNNENKINKRWRSNIYH